MGKKKKRHEKEDSSRENLSNVLEDIRREIKQQGNPLEKLSIPNTPQFRISRIKKFGMPSDGSTVECTRQPSVMARLYGTSDEVRDGVDACPVILDTGCFLTTIPMSLAEASGIEVDRDSSPRIEVSGVGGSQSGYCGTIDLEFADLRGQYLRVPCVYVEDLPRKKQVALLSYDVLLRNFLVVMFDGVFYAWQRGLSWVERDGLTIPSESIS